MSSSLGQNKLCCKIDVLEVLEEVTRTKLWNALPFFLLFLLGGGVLIMELHWRQIGRHEETQFVVARVKGHVFAVRKDKSRSNKRRRQ